MKIILQFIYGEPVALRDEITYIFEQIELFKMAGE
jgi:hypothetical protein